MQARPPQPARRAVPPDRAFRWAASLSLSLSVARFAVGRQLRLGFGGRLRKYSSDAADQVERAASGRDPRRFWDMAHGSAGEIRGALDLADAWGWQVDHAQARVLLDRELGSCGDSPAQPRPGRLANFERIRFASAVTQERTSITR
jgi:hypothetical protein